jgi:hypothetical protein
MPCTDGASMDVRIVEEDMTFTAHRKDRRVRDTTLTCSRPLWLGSHTNASIYDRNRGEIIALTTSRQLVLFDH